MTEREQKSERARLAINIRLKGGTWREVAESAGFKGKQAATKACMFVKRQFELGNVPEEFISKHSAIFHRGHKDWVPAESTATETA